jgi:hypothetical protein
MIHRDFLIENSSMAFLRLPCALRVTRKSRDPANGRQVHASWIEFRNSRRRILPIVDFGSASRKHTDFGTLYAANSRRQYAIRAVSVTDAPADLTT